MPTRGAATPARGRAVPPACAEGAAGDWWAEETACPRLFFAESKTMSARQPRLKALIKGVQDFGCSKLCHFVLSTFSQVCVLCGSHETRSMAVAMQFELHYTNRALVSLATMRSRGAGTATALAVHRKYDFSGDSGALFHPSRDMPGVKKSDKADLVRLVGWQPSVAELCERVNSTST